MMQDIEVTFICSGRKREKPKHSRVLYRVTLAPDKGQGADALENAMDRLSVETSHPLRGPGAPQRGGQSDRPVAGLTSFPQRVWHKNDVLVYRPSGELVPVLPMKCSKCGWQKDFPYVELVGFMEKLHQNGVTEVDISLLGNAKIGSS